MQTQGSRDLFPFVGRQTELADLRECLAGTLQGRGRFVLVSGEAGIGKSRLVEELSRHAALSGAVVCRGACWEGGGAPAFWPWIQILRDLSRSAGAERLAGAGPHLRLLLSDRTGEGAASAPSDSEHARFRLFDETTLALQDAAAATPLVIVLEDLHAADLSSLLLLRFLARDLRDCRILVIGTTREVEARLRPDVSEALDVVAREGRTLSLRGLGAAEVSELVERSCGSPPSPELLAAIVRSTEGSPLFAEEMIRLLVAENGGRLPVRALGELPVPGRVRDMVRRRLEPLAPESRRALAAAAVLGKELDPETLRPVCDLAGDELAEWLSEVESLGLVRASGRGAVFTHGLVRDAAYEILSADERAALHARAAEVLEAASPRDDGSALARIAFHLHAGFPHAGAAKATDFAIAAGRHSVEVCAYEEAVQQYDLALESLEREASCSGARRCEVLLAIGDAKRRAGDVPGAREVFAEAIEISRSLEDPATFAAAALGLGGPWVAMGRVDEGLVGLLEEALDRLGTDPLPLRARVLSRLAMELYFAEGSLERRRALAAEADRIAGALGTPELRAEILSARRFALWEPENAEERLEMGAEIATLARQVRRDELALAGHQWRIIDLLEVGEIAAADREIEAMDEHARRLRVPVFLWQVTLHRALRAILDGRFDEAETLTTAALEHGRKVQPESAEGSFLIQRLVLRREQGRVGEMVEAVEELVRRYSGRLNLQILLPFVHGEVGDAARARSTFEQALGAGPSAGYSRLGEMALAAEVAHRLDDRERAPAFYAALAPYAERNAILGRSSASLGPVAHYLGLVASTLGRHDEAAGHFENALRQAVRIGARPCEARTRFAYARALSDCGDGERAALLAREALGVARELGMTTLCRQIEGLQAGASGKTAGSAAAATGGAKCSFRREGQFWTIVFGGRVVRLKDVRGLHLIAELLRHPGRELHAIELASTGEGGEGMPQPGARERLEDGLVTSRLDAGDEILDARARGEYKRRMAELEADLEEAERLRDLGHAVRIRGELEALQEALAAAAGFGGRGSRSTSPAERARVSSTKAIRTALRQITRDHPELGRYFDRTIRTGRRFCFDPGDDPEPWTF